MGYAAGMWKQTTMACSQLSLAVPIKCHPCYLQGLLPDRARSDTLLCTLKSEGNYCRAEHDREEAVPRDHKQPG